MRNLITFLISFTTLSAFFFSVGMNANCVSDFKSKSLLMGYFDSCDITSSDIESTYGVEHDHIIFVSPDELESHYLTITEALDHRKDPAAFTSGTVVIYLGNTTFEESITLDDTNHSNTVFVGCSSNATIAAPSDGTETAITHTIEVGLNAENIEFHNLTLKGIGGNYKPSGTADDAECNDGSSSTYCPYLETSTVYLNMAKGFEFEDVSIENNYYQAILVSGSAAYGNITNTTLSAPFPGSGDYDDMIGIRVSGSTTTPTTISNLSFADPVDYGVIIIDGNANIEDSTLDGILNWAVYLDQNDSQPTATITDTSVTNSHLGIYSTDASTLNLNDVTIDTTNELGLISCQYNSTDFSQSTNNITNGSISNIMFDTITVEGSGTSLSNCSTYNAQMNGYSGDCTASSVQLCDF